MLNEFTRTELLLGKEAMDKMKNYHVAIFGVGKTGSLAAEAIARCAVGKITLVDNGVLTVQDIGGNIIAMHSTIGKSKTEVMKNRILDINPKAEVNSYNVFYDETVKIPFEKFDYIIDTFEDLEQKFVLIQRAKQANTPIISQIEKTSDGLGFKVSELKKIKMCDKTVKFKIKLKQVGVTNLKVVCAKENGNDESLMFSNAGLVLAGEVILDLLER